MNENDYELIVDLTLACIKHGGNVQESAMLMIPKRILEKEGGLVEAEKIVHETIAREATRK